MFCENCGHTLQPHNKFCPKCGTPVSSQSGQIPSYGPTPPVPPASPAFVDAARGPVMYGSMGQPQAKKSGCGKILLILGILGVVLAAGIGAAIYYGYRFAEGKLKSSEAYTTAVAALKSSPAATDKLGDIKETGFPLGSFKENANGSGMAAFRVSVTGTKAKGSYDAVLYRRSGTWQLASGKVTLENGEVINIKSATDSIVDEDDLPGNNSNIGPSIAPPKPGKPTGQTISGGVLNGKAIEMPEPAYPAIAKAAHASGTVTVQVLVDEKGQVVSAQAVSGHPLLQASAVEAAKKARFGPTLVNGHPVSVRGILTYNFEAQ